MSVPSEISDTPLGADESLVTDTPDNCIDVRDHGAELDGSTDDSDAIQAALDAAADGGDTVLLPEGTALIDSAVKLGAEHSGVTLKGTGPDSVMQMSAGHNNNHQLISLDPRRDGDPLTDVTLRDFRIDGQGDTQNDKQGWGILTWSSDNGDENILFENIWAHDFSGSQFQIHTADTTIRCVSSWGATHYHGIGLECSVDDPDRPAVVEYAHCRENQIHGVDASNGHTVIRKVLSEDNGWGGKNSDEGYTGHWEDVVFQNNEKCGYMSINGEVDHVTMKRVMARDNGWTGLRFVGDMSFDLEDLVLLGNDTKDARHGNIYIGGPVVCEATRILTGSPANGEGYMTRSHSNGRPSGTIGELVHDGHEIDDESDIDISKTTEGSVDPLPIPTNPDMDSGGPDDGSADDGGSDGGEDETDDPTSDLPHLLVIDGSDVGDSLNYEFSVTGEIEKSTEAGASINDVDVITGSDVSGWVTRTVDAYRYSGEVVNFAASQSDDVDLLSLSVDGETVTIVDLSDAPTETDDGDTGGNGSDDSSGSDGSDGSDGTGDSGGETGDGGGGDDTGSGSDDTSDGTDGGSDTGDETTTNTLTLSLEYEGDPSDLTISVNGTDVSLSDN